MIIKSVKTSPFNVFTERGKKKKTFSVEGKQNSSGEVELNFQRTRYYLYPSSSKTNGNTQYNFLKHHVVYSSLLYTVKIKGAKRVLFENLR